MLGAELQIMGSADPNKMSFGDQIQYDEQQEDQKMLMNESSSNQIPKKVQNYSLSIVDVQKNDEDFQQQVPKYESGRKYYENDLKAYQFEQSQRPMIRFNVDDNPFQASRDYKDNSREGKAFSMMDYPITSEPRHSLKKIKEEKTYSSKRSLNSVNEKQSQDEDGATGGTGQSMNNHDDSRNNISVQSKGSKSAVYDKSGDKKNYKNILT